MKETKTTVKGMVKRGLVLCMIGVMALGMVACGGKDKKSTSTQPKTKLRRVRQKGRRIRKLTTQRRTTTRRSRTM